ncbi:peptidase, M50 family [Ancylostoma duodenale]|uniref:Peptidase, M50 family n=1 Tax=Ancylostoma duodenale TaxID=51022 RepID=A0A0C2D899_9BILA|nr:peptidase, M50 family [Ancylostoma duodenale]
MLFTTALSYFLISWSSVFLLDYVLRIKNFAPYVNFANKYGLEVAPFQAPTPDDLPPPPTEAFDVLEGSADSETGLVPIIPGVNLPWSHIPIFMIVLAAAAIIHELGHSSAAKTYNVRVNGFGVFLLGLYPGAFTDIDPDSLRVDSRSGLYGAGGLSVGNVVVSIDDCAIRKHEDWRECVRHLEKEKHGQCVPRRTVEASLATKTSLSLDELHCCDDFTNITHAHMCFESMLDVTTKQFVTKAHSLNRVLRVGAVEPAQEAVHEKRKRAKQFSCLSAQYVTSQPSCSNTTSCARDKEGDERVCVFPALFNGTQLARITVKNHQRPVLYVGDLDELITYVRIDPLVARFSWIPHYWAESVELVPKYLFTLSLALGLLNSVPCYALDGQYLVITCVNWAFKMFAKR